MATLMPPKENSNERVGCALGTDPLWTVKEVSEYLRLKPETVRMMARNGRLPSIKIGRVWRFETNQIKEWLDVQNHEVGLSG